jgi:hypothetical protein
MVVFKRRIAMRNDKIACLALLALTTGAPALAGDLSASAAFARLKSLEGRWEGHIAAPDGPAGAVEYKVTSGGNTVMEFMFPGTDHEMVSTYYLDGDALVAKHYCVMGNQPEMKLVPGASSESALLFAFSGGTNLNAAADAHIHEGKIVIRGEELESEWAVYAGGKETSRNRFFLTRAQH